jgi:phosphonate transport system substrate-binding protein
MRGWRYWLLAAGLTWASFQCAAREIVIGAIEENPAAEISKTQPLADYLAARLRAQGVSKVRIVVVETIEEMAALFGQQRVDLLMDSPYPALELSMRTGAEVRLRRWKKGKSSYHGVLVARSDAGIERLDQLRGKLLALEVSSSTSGFFLPMLALEAAGLATRELASLASPVAAGEVGYVFSLDDENTIAMLMRGRVHAAAFGSHEYESLRPAEKERIRIFYQSPPVPRQLVVLRKGLDHALGERICAVLKAMAEDPEASRVLEALDRTTRFDEIPDEQNKTLDFLRATIKKQRR